MKSLSVSSPTRIQDVNEAEADFKMATSYGKDFAFAHIAHAEFAHSQGKERCFLLLLKI